MGLVLHLVRDLVGPLSGLLVGTPYDYWDYEENPNTNEIPWPPPELPAGQLYVVTANGLVVMTTNAADWVVVDEAMLGLPNPSDGMLVRLTDGRFIQMVDESLVAVLNTHLILPKPAGSIPIRLPDGRYILLPDGRAVSFADADAA